MHALLYTYNACMEHRDTDSQYLMPSHKVSALGKSQRQKSFISKNPKQNKNKKPHQQFSNSYLHNNIDHVSHLMRATDGCDNNVLFT